MDRSKIAMEAATKRKQAARDPREEALTYLPLDRQRASRFLDDWESYVLALLRRMRVEEEEEVLYRVFDRALAALPGFRGESRISTWLYRIARREGLRHLEKTGKRAEREAPIEAAAAQADPGDGPARILERLESAERVREALARLSPRDREVLALRYLEELKFSELAERLDIPLGTAKVRVHRALARLGNELEDQ